MLQPGWSPGTSQTPPTSPPSVAGINLESSQGSPDGGGEEWGRNSDRPGVASHPLGKVPELSETFFEDKLLSVSGEGGPDYPPMHGSLGRVLLSIPAFLITLVSLLLSERRTQQNTEDANVCKDSSSIFTTFNHFAF